MVTISGSGTPWGSAWQISSSGIQDANLRLDVTANNVANGNTDNFIPDRVDSVELSSGGVRGTISESSDSITTNQSPANSSHSQTDYATEGVNLMLAKNAFQANALAFKVQTEVSKTLIDTMA